MGWLSNLKGKLELARAAWDLVQDIADAAEDLAAARARLVRKAQAGDLDAQLTRIAETKRKLAAARGR